VPDSTILSTRGLVSGYGRVQTLHGVDIDVPAGRTTAIIGPNGSGKSTLLKSIAGLLKPWSGSVVLTGTPITGLAAHRLVTRGMCMVPQGRVVFPLLTVEENLRMSAFTVRSRADVESRIREVFEFFPVLADRRHQLASNLSGGEQVMLSIAKVIMVKPRLLLLDEPSLGLSPKLVDFVYDRIGALRVGGLTTLLVEQNVPKALNVADNVIVLVLGEVRFQGPPAELEETIDLGTLFLEGKIA
jgi:ABC-type branched-subunit amino acid transport system ATPase component